MRLSSFNDDYGRYSSNNSDSSSYYTSSSGSNNNSGPYYGTTADAYDVRYGDDCHQTYGKQYNNER